MLVMTVCLVKAWMRKEVAIILTKQIVLLII